MGAFDLVMRDNDGNESLQTGSFLEITPQTQLVFTTALTQDWRPSTTALPITATISMRDEDDGTRYETDVLYRDDDARQQLAEFGFEAGWSKAIDPARAACHNHAALKQFVYNMIHHPHQLSIERQHFYGNALVNPAVLLPQVV